MVCMWKPIGTGPHYIYFLSATNTTDTVNLVERNVSTIKQKNFENTFFWECNARIQEKNKWLV